VAAVYAYWRAAIIINIVDGLICLGPETALVLHLAESLSEEVGKLIHPYTDDGPTAHGWGK
jgi:hypothetical protein